MKNMAKKLFIAAMCLSMSVTAVPAVTGTTQTVSAEQTTAKNGLYHEGNAWNYYTDGAINKANTLVKYNGSWWYVHDGKIDFSANTLVKFNGSWWYVHGGKVDFSANTLVKFNGSWWYVHGGKVDFGARTLVKYNGTWWFVEGGRVNWNSETVVKYNGAWFYVKNGQVNWNSGETLCKYNHFWWYIKNGKIDFNSTTLCKYNGTWWYVRGGRVDFGNEVTYAPKTEKEETDVKFAPIGAVGRPCTGELMYYDDNGYAYYDDNGKYVQHSDLVGDAGCRYTLCYYNGSWWAVTNGHVDFNAFWAIRYGEYFYQTHNGRVDFSGASDTVGYSFDYGHFEFHNGVCPITKEMGNRAEM